MRSIQDLVRERLEDDGEEDLLEYLSEGEGEPFDSLEEPAKLDERFPSTVIVCNVPKVNKAKYDKLLAVLGKRIDDKIGPNEKTLPLNKDTEMTEGFLLCTFPNEEAANNAIAILDGIILDKAHTFKAMRVDTFDDIVNRSEEFSPEKTLQSFSRTDFRLWLADKKCREQILLRYQTETEIYWHDTLSGAPVLCYGGEREKRNKKIWCDWRTQWSPWGSYLATFHYLGIALWAGPEFTKKMRFAHESVKHIDISPNEDFLLTWNGEQDENAVRIFRVLTGECVRKCKTPSVAPLGGDFPHFLWSADGRYFAECDELSIKVRDTQSRNFEPIKDEEGKKRKFKFDGLQTFQWSPKDNVLAVWISEKDNNPARLVLVEIPSGVEKASRSRTQVEASMHWQSEGDYLCLLATKLSKTKKKGATNLEIFRYRDRDIPVDIVEVRDTVRGFFWETKGCRFAVLTADEAGHHPKLLLYALGGSKCEMVAQLDLPSNSFNQVYWAPEGQYFVCAAIGQGDLLFGNLTPDNKLEILHKDEHFMLTGVEWDPSSRYLITSVTQSMMPDVGSYKYSQEAGYKIWTFQGRVLHQQQKEKLWQIVWRPHPPSLLTTKRQQNIRKDIKQFTKKYDTIDEKAKESARNAIRQEREEKLQAFRDVLARVEEYKADRNEQTGWDEAWHNHLEGQGWEMHEQTVEEELDVSEELISG